MKEISKEEVLNLKTGTKYVIWNPLSNRSKVEIATPCVGCDNNPDYKSRIDKAIEYIEQWRDTKTKRIDSRLKRTLEILKGEGNE
jgi:hypothetical protein